MLEKNTQKGQVLLERIDGTAMPWSGTVQSVLENAVEMFHGPRQLFRAIIIYSAIHLELAKLRACTAPARIFRSIRVTDANATPTPLLN